MKKTVRWIISAPVFVVCFLILFAKISETMRLKTHDTDMIHSFYDVEENTLDVLALGSSHVYYGFQPNILWGQNGITSYVMGCPQQSVATSYFLLKEAFRYQKPKVVLLESYFFYYNGLYKSKARVREAFDGIRFGDAKREMIDAFFPDMPLEERLSFYVPFLMYHSRWAELQPYDYKPLTYFKGGLYRCKTVSCSDPGMDIKKRKIPKVNLDYLDKIAALCKENGAKLVVFGIPFALQGKSYRKRQGVQLSLEEYLKKKDIPFLFYQKTGELNLDFEQDFLDLSHVNNRGQEKVSRNLGTYLSEVCGLAGHKDDPDFASWEEDYQKYLRYVQEQEG